MMRGRLRRARRGSQASARRRIQTGLTGIGQRQLLQGCGRKTTRPKDTPRLTAFPKTPYQRYRHCRQRLMTKRVLYVTECKMNGNGIDLVIDKQVRAVDLRWTSSRVTFTSTDFPETTSLTGRGESLPQKP